MHMHTLRIHAHLQSLHTLHPAHAQEFGNPNEAAAHQAVLSFSPVHNVPRGGAYPR